MELNHKAIGCFFKYALANLSFLDTTKFSYSMFFLHKYDKRNLQEWMDENNITTQGKKGIRNLSLSFQGIPEELSAYAFFKAIREGFGSAEFIQFRESDEWLKKMGREVKEERQR